MPDSADSKTQEQHHTDAVDELYGKHGWCLSDAGDAVLSALADNKDKFMTAKELVEYCLKRSKKHK